MDEIKPIFKERSASIEDFRGSHKPTREIDRYEEMLEELFLVRNPRFKFVPDHAKEFAAFLEEHKGGRRLDEVGEWVYFPWNGILMHYLSEADHFEVRTARNRNLITKEEQDRLYSGVVAIAGLSVGSHPALTLSMMGASKRIHIADADEISASNLNRIRYDYTRIGEKKCDVVKELIYQMNPYADVRAFNKGVNPDNVDAFLEDVDVLVEEVDHLETKISLRLEAKKRKIPVVMGTDNGDGVILDIERFDLHPDLKLFNGVIGDVTIEEFKRFPPTELPKLATKIAGPKVVAPRMLTSLLEVGKTLYSWPQLGDAATLCGVAVAFVVKRILLEEAVREGKVEVNLDLLLDPTYEETDSKKAREDIRARFMETIGLTDV
jgi:hypothetical protein